MKTYEEFQNEMILRDYLAVDRTHLANERTLLAYTRTCIGLFATGVALINFIDHAVLTFFGYAFIIISPIIFIFGLYRFLKTMHRIKRGYYNAANIL